MGRQPAAGMGIVKQPKGLGMSVPQRGTKVSEGLREGMQAIQVDEIKVPMRGRQGGKKGITGDFMKDRVWISLRVNIKTETWDQPPPCTGPLPE
jgi:hypothetical protein